MLRCNEDVAGIDASIECTWWLTSSMPNPTVREVDQRTRHLLRQIMAMGEGFLDPPTVEVSVACLDPTLRLELHHDWDSEEIQKVEVHSPDGVSREALFEAIDDVECTADTIQYSSYVEYDELSANLHIGGEDRWVDRESEYLVHWDSFGDRQTPEIDVDADEHSRRDPLEIVLDHGSLPDGTYEHDIKIQTFCHLWWAETDPDV